MVEPAVSGGVGGGDGGGDLEAVAVYRRQIEDISAGQVVVRRHKPDRTKEVRMVLQLKAAIAQAQLPSSGYLFPAAKWTRATVKQYRIQRQGNGDYHFEKVGERPPRSTSALGRWIRRCVRPATCWALRG